MIAETQFLQLLKKHEYALGDRRQFAGLIRDFMPGMALQANILLNLYDLHIHTEILSAGQIDNAFVYRFTKLLCDEYGISRRNADWAVSAWCNSYGRDILGKKITQTPPEDMDFSEKSADEPADTTFDVATGEYIADWRNVYEYEIAGGGVIIKKYIDFDTEDVTVPDTIEGYPVTEIGEEAFFNCKAMKNIYLPSTLKLIRGHAFENCTFESIRLPESLIDIEYSAFEYCLLKSVAIPPSVKIINRLVFGHCEELTDVKLTDGLKCIEGRAFFHCGKLESIDVPQGVLEIGAHAFDDCTSLKKIRIPRSVIRMGRQDYVGENVFGDRANQNLTIYCQAGSEALKYARRHNIDIAQYDEFCW